MSNTARCLYPAKRFRVRDISAHYDEPRFDLVFDDEENGVERYSESVWDTEPQAQIQATMLEDAQVRPVHWDVLQVKNN